MTINLSTDTWMQRLKYNSMAQWKEDADKHPFPIHFAWWTMSHARHVKLRKKDEKIVVDPFEVLMTGGLCWQINVGLMILWEEIGVGSELWYLGKKDKTMTHVVPSIWIDGKEWYFDADLKAIYKHPIEFSQVPEAIDEWWLAGTGEEYRWLLTMDKEAKQKHWSKMCQYKEKADRRS